MIQTSDILLGLEIVATSLDWQPFIAHENCNSEGRRCYNYGMLPDLMDIWARNYNFTWDIFAGYDGDWGLFPVSGVCFDLHIISIECLNKSNICRSLQCKW